MVERSGAEWLYRRVGDVRAATAPDRQSALDRLTAVAGEGALFVVVDAEGKVIERGQVGRAGSGGSDAAEEETTRESFDEQVEREGGQLNKVLEWALPIAAAAGSGFLSPALAEQGDWFGIFFATLAWSGGCAAATYFIVSARLQGFQAVTAAAASLIGAWLIAFVIGVGVLDIDDEMSTFSSLPGALRVIAVFVFAAIHTYGIVGTVLSGGIGVWLGHRASRHLAFS